MKRNAVLAAAFCVLLGSVVVGAGVAQAAEAVSPAASIKELQQAHLQVRKVGTAYYKFALENRKPEERSKMLALSGQAEAAIVRNGSAVVMQAWKEVKAASMADPYLNGDVDQLKLYHMEDSQFAFDQAVSQETSRLKTAGRLPVSSKADMLSDLAVLMERMAGTYIRNAADPLGGSNYAGRDKSDPAIMAKEFAEQLDKAGKAYAGNADASTELADVYKKWNFIRARLIDYNQKTVPYIVSTYNDQITRKLDALFVKQAN